MQKPLKTLAAVFISEIKFYLVEVRSEVNTYECPWIVCLLLKFAWLRSKSKLKALLVDKAGQLVFRATLSTDWISILPADPGLNECMLNCQPYSFWGIE